MKKRIIAFILSILMLLLCGCNIEFLQEEAPVMSDCDFSVHFIDVGQGDCILIRCGEHNMLIDAGEVTAENAVADYLDKERIDEFDYLVGTHAHSDHIGSLDYPVSHFDVGEFLVSPQKDDSKTYEILMKAVKKADVPVRSIMAGESFSLGDAKVDVLGPCSKKYDDVNNSSVVLKVTFGKTSFLFMGDAEELSEKEMLEENADLKADVLKVGHHGSTSSTSYVFLREVMPKYAVIQVGAGNSYGHPKEKTLSRLNDAGVTVYRNDVHGNIVFTSDGENLEIKTSEDEEPAYSNRDDTESKEYIGNINSKKFHTPDCSGLPAEKNRIYFASREEAIKQGYEPCGTCDP